VGGVSGVPLSEPGLDCGVAVEGLADADDVFPDAWMRAAPVAGLAALPPLPELLLLPLWDLRLRGWYLYSGCSRLWRTRRRSASRWNGSFSSSFKILKLKKLKEVGKLKKN
jgi:hypothetical protein